MEHVDIVDKNLNILYTTSKEEAHQKGLLHKTVNAAVVNSAGDFLLVHQSDHKQDAGQYVSPVGGHIRAGETNEVALKRETLEEIGVQHFQYRHIGTAIFNRKVIGRHENHYFIFYEIESDADPVLNDESDGFRWFSRQEIEDALKTNPKLFGDAFYFVWRTFYTEL